ncbi:MAG: NAD-dependent epimerase/dehydratase family protein, partial [Bdellovibrionales bacterium]|nr:NAD-dependent epimerase/dehydratase family protein [Bdellovibrionales bacterium]
MRHKVNRILVTGATGFFGKKLCAFLSAQDCDVIRLSTSPTSQSEVHFS